MRHDSFTVLGTTNTSTVHVENPNKEAKIGFVKSEVLQEVIKNNTAFCNAT